MDDAETFGQAMQRIRRAREKTQANVGEATGYGTSTVSRIENDKMRPTAHFVAGADEYLQGDGELITLFAEQARRHTRQSPRPEDSHGDHDLLQLLLREVRHLKEQSDAIVDSLKTFTRAAALGLAATALIGPGDVSPADAASDVPDAPEPADFRIAGPRAAESLEPTARPAEL